MRIEPSCDEINRLLPWTTSALDRPALPTVQEVAELLRVSPETVRAWIAKGWRSAGRTVRQGTGPSACGNGSKSRRQANGDRPSSVTPHRTGGLARALVGDGPRRRSAGT
ncbi:helix-turn-helix domain-containing protein [uncultured Ornithinimicrobium sp.]|uniref:helix-turn-helix domain-containing protein n=1 Tax=uncultured Ornithinimicrobium sp. TaxID=259307 RepID=UPI0033904024